MNGNDFIDAVQAIAKDMDEAIAAILNSEDKDGILLLEERLRARGVPSLAWYRKLCTGIIAASERKRTGVQQ